MAQDSARVVFRVDYSVKQDFIRKASDLGYPNASECLRDMVEIVTYNGERTPKEKVLTHHLARIQNVMSAEQAEKVWGDFCRFMEEYRYAIYTARLTEEEFIETFNVYDTYALALFNYAQTQWQKMYMGQRSFDEWDQILVEMKERYHYDELMEVHNSALKRLLEENGMS